MAQYLSWKRQPLSERPLDPWPYIPQETGVRKDEVGVSALSALAAGCVGLQKSIRTTQQFSASIH